MMNMLRSRLLLLIIMLLLGMRLGRTLFNLVVSRL